MSLHKSAKIVVFKCHFWCNSMPTSTTRKWMTTIECCISSFAYQKNASAPRGRYECLDASYRMRINWSNLRKMIPMRYSRKLIINSFRWVTRSIRRIKRQIKMKKSRVKPRARLRKIKLIAPPNRTLERSRGVMEMGRRIMETRMMNQKK